MAYRSRGSRRSVRRSSGGYSRRGPSATRRRSRVASSRRRTSGRTQTVRIVVEAPRAATTGGLPGLSLSTPSAARF